MKLVDIDDISQQPPGDQPFLSHPSDESFTSPRTLSILDDSMNAILNRCDINDSEKWALYHQTLQRYLYHIRNKQKSTTQQTDDIRPYADLQRKHTPEQFDFRISDHNITGITPIKDSIEHIGPPQVRQFFENARQSNVNQLSPILPISSDDSMNFSNFPQTPPQQHQQPMSIPPTKHTTKRTRKRGEKRNASNNITGSQPRKVVAIEERIASKQLYRNRRPVQSNHDFYWNGSTAK